MLRNKCNISIVIVACLLIFVALSDGCAEHNGNNQRVVYPQQLAQVVGCLVAAHFIQQYGLDPLGLKVGDWAWISYHHGSVHGMSATPEEYYVVIYSADGYHGSLLLALPNDRGGFDAVPNIYQLTKHGSSWTADEGNGGYVVYNTMGRLVTELSRFPLYHIQLLPGGSTCTTDN